MFEHLRSHAAKFIRPPLIITMTFLAPLPSSWAADDKMLVLDVSGSMWGQIENKTKIDIARDVLKNLISEWPEGTNTGLIAYGHRDKGNCTDIEVVLPVGPLNVDEFGTVVDGLTPRGKTPLSDAVRIAADELKFTEQKATVVLISDGKETCDKDPCALGLELERLGVDFTAHVIGFDVKSIDDQQGLRCLSTNTGGDFFTAATDKELSEALEKAIKSETTNDYPIVALNAPIEVKPSSNFFVNIVAEEGLDGRVKLFAHDSTEVIDYQRIQTSADGGYKDVSLRAPETTGSYVLKFFTPDDKKELASRAIQVATNEIELNAHNEALISSTVDVQLIASPQHEGRIALYLKNESEPFAFQAITADGDAKYKVNSLNTPSTPGEYHLRFENPEGTVLAERPLSIEPADIAIEATDKAAIATNVTATLLAPAGILGRLQLHPAGQSIALDAQRVIESASADYKPIDFQLPSIPGDYEIRFMSLSNDVLATTIVEATKSDIGLTMPAKAITKEVVVVTPVGPPGLVGNIQLESDEAGIIGSAFPLESSSDNKYKAINIKIPDQAGAYFLRFYTLRGELILQEQITVTD